MKLLFIVIYNVDEKRVGTKFQIDALLTHYKTCHQWSDALIEKLKKQLPKTKRVKTQLISKFNVINLRFNLQSESQSFRKTKAVLQSLFSIMFIEKSESALKKNLIGKSR